MKTIHIVIVVVIVIVILLFIFRKNIEFYENDTVQTIVVLRHGEKPVPEGLGNLTCQGLNRASALVKVMNKKFAKPDYIFAPKPTQKVPENKNTYYYVRPLITASYVSSYNKLPINTPFGFKEIKELNTELQQSKYKSSTIFVFWEHKMIVEFAKLLMKTYKADPNKIPSWSNTDYDTIFVFKIKRTGGGKSSISFSTDKEGLNGQSTMCP